MCKQSLKNATRVGCISFIGYFSPCTATLLVSHTTGLIAHCSNAFCVPFYRAYRVLFERFFCPILQGSSRTVRTLLVSHTIGPIAYCSNAFSSIAVRFGNAEIRDVILPPSRGFPQGSRYTFLSRGCRSDIHGNRRARVPHRCCR